MARTAYPQSQVRLLSTGSRFRDQPSDPRVQAIELQTVRATSLDRERVKRPGAGYMAGFATEPADIG
jgi:hypothetical protein